MSRIADIESHFGVPAAPASVSGASSADFGGVLAGAMGGDGSPTGTDVVADAQRYLGVPYKWGGTNPATGLDCSGFVQRVYADLGVQLPRVAADQARAGRAVP